MHFLERYDFEVDKVDETGDFSEKLFGKRAGIFHKLSIILLFGFGILKSLYHSYDILYLLQNGHP